MPVSEEAFRVLSERVYSVEKQQAVKAATDASVEVRLGKIEVILSRLTWLIITGIGGGFLAFIMSGGLAAFSSAVGS